MPPPTIHAIGYSRTAPAGQAARAQRLHEPMGWTTAACLGQMKLTAVQAKDVGELFKLSANDIRRLQRVSYKGSLPTTVPPIRSRRFREIELPYWRNRGRRARMTPG